MKATVRPGEINPEKIGFDFDCVIADTANTYLEILCKKYGYCSYSLEDIVNFEVEECIDVPAEITIKIFSEMEKDPLKTGVSPIPGAVQTLTKLAQVCQPAIITARNLTEPVYLWLETHLPALDQATIRNFRVAASGDHNDKLTSIKQYGITHFVDDRAMTCQTLAEAGITPLVFDQPWNRGRHTQQVITNWQEINTLLFGKEEKS